MSKFQSNFTVFEVHLEDLKAIVSKNEHCDSLKMVLNSVLRWEAIGSYEKEIVNDFFKYTEIRKPLLMNSIYMTAAAGFESYLNGTIEALIHILNEDGKPFREMGQDFANKYIELNGRILSSIFSPPDYVKLNFLEICKNLGTLDSSSGICTLNPEIAAFVKIGIDLDKYFEFLKKCGSKIAYDSVAQTEELKKHFTTNAYPSGTRDIQSYFAEIIDKRNKIAHTGQSVADINYSDVIFLLGSLRYLANGIQLSLTGEYKGDFRGPRKI